MLKIHDVFHVSLLQPYHVDGNVQPPPVPEMVDGELVYEVEKVLNHRDRKVGRKLCREYLILWKGYDQAHSTWEPVTNLTQCTERIQSYWSHRKGDNVSPLDRKDRKRSGKSVVPDRPKSKRSRRKVRLVLEGLDQGLNLTGAD